MVIYTASEKKTKKKTKNMKNILQCLLLWGFLFEVLHLNSLTFLPC